MRRKQTIALLLSLAMAVSAFSAANVSEAKKKKSGGSKKSAAVKLSKSKLSIAIGGSEKLKVKKAKAKVKWSSSNKKVVKIGKLSGKKKDTATLKGLKLGSSKVTAKVGNKKATCKVVVESSIKNVTVDKFDSHCIVLTLKKKKAINQAKVTISKKDYKDGVYNETAIIRAMTGDTGQTTYRFYTNKGFYSGDYVKVSLSKSDFIEAQYKPEIVSSEASHEVIKKGKVMDPLPCTNYFSREIGTGKYSLASGTLPEGVTLNPATGVIKGIPAVAGDFPITINIQDELKRKSTAELIIHVYDELSIKAAPVNVDCVPLNDWTESVIAKVMEGGGSYNGGIYREYSVTPHGGSGRYNFSLAAPADVMGVKLSTDPTAGETPSTDGYTSTELQIPYTMTEGVHTYTINITDAKNPAIISQTTVTLNVQKFFNISGSAKDVQGKELSGNGIYMIPSTADYFSDYISGLDYERDATGKIIDYERLSSTSVVGSRYPGSSPAPLPNQILGQYAAEVPAGDYIVKVGASDLLAQTQSNAVVNADNQVIDLVCPVQFFKVDSVATFANGAPLANQRIYFEMKDEQYEYGETFFADTDATGRFSVSLPANTYAAYIDPDNGKDYETGDGKLYFREDIAVTSGDFTAPAITLSISKTLVNGTVKIYGPNNTHRKTLYFCKDNCSLEDGIKVSSDYGTYNNDGYEFNYSVLLSDGTYTVKTDYDYSTVTLGTVTVAGQPNIAQNFEYSPVGTVQGEVNPAKDLTSATETSVTTTGDTGYVFTKINVTEAGTYDIRLFNSEKKSELGNVDLKLLDSSYKDADYPYAYDDGTVDNSWVAKEVSLRKGTYYLGVCGRGHYTNSMDAPYVAAKVGVKIYKHSDSNTVG